MDIYVVHLAAAAFVGAFTAAVSSFLMHQRILSQILEYIGAFEKRARERDWDESMEKKEKSYSIRRITRLPDDEICSGTGGSCSMPDDEGDNVDEHDVQEVPSVPTNLYRLRMLPPNGIDFTLLFGI